MRMVLLLLLKLLEKTDEDREESGIGITAFPRARLNYERVKSDLLGTRM